MKQRVAVSPSSRPRGPFRARTRFMVAAVSGCFAASVLANPVGPGVVAGTASIAQLGKVLTVTNSNGAILSWNQFNIAAGETTRFIQPTASSAVLNRVLGADPSQIYGTLSSNGKVWLINPAGILVGASGRIDTAGFVASTLGVSNADFLAGRLNFGSSEGSTAGIGSVVNQGAITTSAGGSVYLVAPNVTNQGIITTPQGETILAAGQTVHLVDTGTPGVKVEITGAEGNATNLGDIVADAGRIGIAGVIVRNSGSLNASSAVSEGGRVFLRASQDAYVDGAGRIVTTGTKGGSVEVLGNRVAVMNTASIDASGTGATNADGGTIKVGGDYQGKNPDIQNATVTYFGPDASLKADAGSVGAGGTVIVWADDTTRAHGSISARGGSVSGDGGFVETSGKQYLAVDGVRVDTRAPNGRVGAWLLDPSDITITMGGSTTSGSTPVPSNPPGILTTEFTTTPYGGASSTISDTTINSQLITTDVIIHTAGGTGGNGDITVTGANIFADSNGWALTLAADGSGSPTGGNITVINSTINVDDGVTLLAGWNGVMPPYGPDGNTLSSADVIPGRGNITISGSTLQSPGASGGGFVALWAGKDISLTSGTLVQAVSVDVSAGNDIKLTAAGGGSAQINTALSGTMQITAGNQLNLQGSNLYGGQAVLNANGSQNIQAGNIVLTAGYGSNFTSAQISALGDQVITTTNGGISLTGTGSATTYGDSVIIAHGSTTAASSGNQLIDIHGGALTVYGGTGTLAPLGTTIAFGTTTVAQALTPPSCSADPLCAANPISGNFAGVGNNYGGQTLNLYGGAIGLFGGSGGTSNRAFISSIGAGPGTITGAGAITVTGGASGGNNYTPNGRDYILANFAGIFSQSSAQEITAASLQINGAPNLTAQNGANAGATVRGVGQTLTISGAIELNAGSGGVTSVNILSSAGQGISAGSIKLYAGAGGYTNSAQISAASNQTINITGTGGLLELKGGAGAGSDPADGTSNNYAALNAATGQTIAFVSPGTGTIALTGGSVGIKNYALISNRAGAQVVTGSPSITLTGGDTGGSPTAPTAYTSSGFMKGKANSAVIASGHAFFDANNNVILDPIYPSDPALAFVSGTQFINANQVTIKGTPLTGVANVASGAGLFSSSDQTISVTGALALLGGDSSLDTRTRVWSMSGTQLIDADKLSSVGPTSNVGTGFNISTVGSWGEQFITLRADGVSGPALLLMNNNGSSANVLNNSQYGGQTVTFTGTQAQLKIEGAQNTLGTNDNPAQDAHGNQLIQFQYGGNILVRGVGVAGQSGAGIRSTGTQSIYGATAITLIADNAAYGSAAIVALDAQYIEANAISLTGGGGTAFGSFAAISHVPEVEVRGAGDQTIVMTGSNASITVQGGSGSGFDPLEEETGNFAAIRSHVGTQTVRFDQTGGKISIYGGSVGSGNRAGIKSDYGQTISGNPTAFLQGGPSGGVASTPNQYGGNDHGNDAGIFGGDSDAVGNSQSTLNFASLTINGGSADFAQAGVGGDIMSLNVLGNVTLTGGSSNVLDANSDAPNAATAAYIGHDDFGSLGMQVGGNLLLTGGTGTSGLAVIGSVGGADVTVNVAGATTLQSKVSAAGIGALPGNSGSGKELVNLNTVGALSIISPGNINWRYTNAHGGNIKLSAGGTVTQTAPIDTASLYTISYGGTLLTLANTVGIYSGSNSSSGNVAFNNTASPLTVAMLSNAAGDVTIDNAGAVIINGPMTAGGVLSVTAHSPVTVTSTGSVTAGGDINLTASSSSVLSTIDLLTIAGAVTSNNGNINMYGGSGIVVTSTVAATNGNVLGDSPYGDITQVPANSITAPKGTVTLTAFSAGPKPENIDVVVPAEAVTITDLDNVLQDTPIVVVLTPVTGSGSSSSLGEQTAGGTQGTFGGSDEKKEDEKKDSKGAAKGTEDKPAAKRIVGTCT